MRLEWGGDDFFVDIDRPLEKKEGPIQLYEGVGLDDINA